MSNSNFGLAGWLLADLFLIMAIIFLIATPASSVPTTAYEDVVDKYERERDELQAIVDIHETTISDLHRSIQEIREHLENARIEKLALEERLRELSACRREVDFKFDQIIFYNVLLDQSETNQDFRISSSEALKEDNSIYLNLDQAMTNLTERQLQELGRLKFTGNLLEYFETKSADNYRIALIQTFGFADRDERERGNMTTRSRKINSRLIPELQNPKGLYYHYQLPLLENLQSDGWHTALYSGLIEPNTVRTNIYYVKTENEC